MNRYRLEYALVEYCRELHARGWVANHDGNITARLSEGQVLATPSAISKRKVERADLVVVDLAGRKLSGIQRPFSELALHLAAYRARPDAQAVIHAHPPVATGFAIAGRPVRPTLLAEATVSLGTEIPLVPYAAPAAVAASASLAEALRRAPALLLEQHGVLTFGSDLETAFLRLELVEHLAKIQQVATELGHGHRDVDAARPS
jgi:L-fuculose-phosphate aldolase